MKKLYFIIASILIGTAASAQCSVIVTNHNNVSCNGANDGSATTAVVGIPNYTYLWSPGGQTVSNPTGLAPATYTVTMTDANNCQSTATVQITEPQPLSSTLTHTAVTCDSACDGTASATAAGGTSPYTYAWSNSQNTQTITGLCAGTYSVMITDVNGCTTADSVLITQPAQLIVVASSTDATCSTCSDGTASANVTGGTQLYSYSWAPDGQTTQNISGLAPGSYTICVTDAHGCSACDTVVVNAPMGIFSADGKYGVSIYPNPTNNIVHLSTTSPDRVHVRVVLHDVAGKEIFSEEYYAVNGVEKTYDLSKQPSGFYIMEVQMGTSTLTQKIIKY